MTTWPPDSPDAAFPPDVSEAPQPPRAPEVSEAPIAPEYQPADTLPLATARELSAPRAVAWPGYVIGAGLVAYGIMVIIGIITATFELIDAIPLIPILAFITLQIARRIGRRDDNPATVRFIMAAFWAKMIGTIVRSAVTAWYYDNRSDALDYHKWGQYYAPMFRRFDFGAVPDLRGTNFMRFMTGVIYSFTGASSVSGAIVMSFLAFVGTLLLWRAFKRAVPGGEYYRYGLLIFFLPSMLYWPSALGKEGWAVLCLGVASYGVAMVVTGQIGPGITLFLLGVVGVVEMRPHVALVAFFGVVLAALVGRARKPGVGSSALRIVLFVALAVLGVSVPHYWLGMVLVIIFSSQLGWLPATGAGPGGSDAWAWDWAHVQHLVLPANVTGEHGAEQVDGLPVAA